MANPQPCRICETEGAHTLADWLVTAQSDVMGFEPGNTFWVCMPCLAGLALAWLQAQQDPAATEAEEVPEGPGVLEQVEDEEGREKVTSRTGRAPKSSGQTQESGPVEDPQEAPTAHVNQ